MDHPQSHRPSCQSVLRVVEGRKLVVLGFFLPAQRAPSVFQAQRAVAVSESLVSILIVESQGQSVGVN
jgi:hypothetical protein